MSNEIPILKGDLLNMPIGPGHYMVQQCCCSGTVVAGLSSAIAKKWPALHPYKKRVPMGKSHRATEASCSSPGTVDCFVDPVSGAQVLCIYGQYAPGKPAGSDSREARLAWFASGLAKIPTMIPEGSTLYIPYGIGCGLAGGHWPSYYKALCDFAGAKIVLIQKD